MHILRFGIILFFTQLTVVQLHAQSDSIVSNEQVFTIVEDMPVFGKCKGSTKRDLENCSQSNLFKFLKKNFRYPAEARENEIQGRVLVSFVVDTTGEVTDVTVLKGIPEGEVCNQEAVRLISSLPSWQPGKQRGEKVKVKYIVPIRFTLLD